MTVALSAIVFIIAAESLLFQPARKIAVNESTFTGVTEDLVSVVGLQLINVANAKNSVSCFIMLDLVFEFDKTLV